MKRILSLSLAWLLLFQLSTHAQTITVTLPDSVAGKNWVKNLVREELKKVGTTTPTTPVVKLDPCPEGPEIKRIFNVTTSGLEFQFHGNGVHAIEYEVKNAAGVQISHGIVPDLKSNIILIRYSAIPGSYTLFVKGSTCRSDLDSEPFTIGGGTSGAITVPPATNPGQYIPQTIASCLPSHLDLEFTRDGDSYLLTDRANPDQIGGEYEYRYVIGAEVIKTGKGLLSRYRIAGVNPGRVVKFKIRPDKVLNNWIPGYSENPGYFTKDAAQGFSENTSVAFHTYSFPGATGDFVNPIPESYNPGLQNVQWGDITPDFQLPKGHVYIAAPKPWGIEAAFKKGVTHISHYSLPWEEGEPYKYLISLRDQGKSYNDVPRIETVLGITKSGNSGLTWPDGTSKDWWPRGAPSYEEGYQMGLRADINHAIFIGEFTENESWLPPNSAVFFGFYDAYMPRMEERYGKRGIPYLVCHDYLLLGGERLANGRDQAKNLLTTKPEKMPRSNFSPGASLSKTNLIVETVYLAAPDNNLAQPYELAFRLNLFRQMGYEAGVFLQGVHEWWPNNRYMVQYPEGKAYLQNKIPLDPATHIANGFMAHVWGKVFVEWGGNGKVEKKLIPEDWAYLLWYPNGANSPQGGFPYFKGHNDQPYYGYSGSTDLSHFSQKLFTDTYGPVEGGTDQYLRFRIDGGSWITPNANDFVDAYFDKRGFVHSRTKNGKTAFFYINCFTDNAAHTLEVELPNGQKWSGKVAGNGVHAKLL